MLGQFNFTLSFISIRWLDAIDIVLVAILLYQLYKLVKGTVAIRIFIGILAIYLFWKLVSAMQMELLSEILGQFIGVGVLALIIVFQQEIRKFLLMIGTTNFSARKNFLKQLKFLQTEIGSEIDTEKILTACKNMSKTKTGALIVIERTNALDFLINTGDSMNALVNEVILESIFYKNSPLHDGALIIRDNFINSHDQIENQCPLINDHSESDKIIKTSKLIEQKTSKPCTSFTTIESLIENPITDIDLLPLTESEQILSTEDIQNVNDDNADDDATKVTILSSLSSVTQDWSFVEPPAIVYDQTFSDSLYIALEAMFTCPTPIRKQPLIYQSVVDTMNYDILDRLEALSVIEDKNIIER